MGRRAAGLAAAVTGFAVVLVATAGPAYACSFTRQTIKLDSAQAPPGGVVHVSGGPYIEFIPSDDRSSTTTTTLATCPPTRPASHLQVVFVQGDRQVVLAEVDGDTLDLDVTIPADADPGPAAIQAVPNVDPTNLVIVRSSAPQQVARTGPQQLARTGGSRSLVVEAGLGLSLIVFGRTAVLHGRRRHRST